MKNCVCDYESNDLQTILQVFDLLYRPLHCMTISKMNHLLSVLNICLVLYHPITDFVILLIFVKNIYCHGIYVSSNYVYAPFYHKTVTLLSKQMQMLKVRSTPQRVQMFCPFEKVIGQTAHNNNDLSKDKSGTPTCHWIVKSKGVFKSIQFISTYLILSN